MAIWVDADACPNMIKTILYRAAERTETLLIFVANQNISVPASRFIKTLRVEKGFDVADNEIVKQVVEGDLVITSDIPLAADVIQKKAEVITPRGEALTTENVRSRLNIRDFMDTMRASGIQSGGPAALSETDKRQFANRLDRYLASVKK